MDWMKWGFALLIGAMILLLLPQAKAMMQQSREAKAGDWRSVILPILLVLGLVALLMMSV